MPANACLFRARPLSLLTAALALGLLIAPCPAAPGAAATSAPTPKLLAAVVCKAKAPKPPKRDKCREKCAKRNRTHDCADEDGHMMPCPCYCP
jgi:hypothetical protein